MKDIFVDISKLKLGLYALEDTTSAPIGSFRKMSNVQVTDRGGIAPRPGVELLGSSVSSTYPSRSLFNFKKSFGTEEIIMLPYGDKIQIYAKSIPSAGFFTLKSGFTVDKEFGFVTSLVNTSNEDYVIFCNRYDEYMAWNGAVTMLSADVAAAATSVPVFSVLTDEILEEQVATGNSATTFDVSTAPWGPSQWNNMVVFIPSTGKIRKITATTSSQITFDTLGAAPGNVAFQIRKLAFPLTGTVIYNGTEIAYTTLDVYNALPVASAHAGTSGMGVALSPTKYPTAPRGNRLANYLTRIAVCNVRSALARDSGGALQGYSAAGSGFISKLKDPFDFSYSAARVAGEGDILGMPYGGGDHTDVQAQEDAVYFFKNDYIEEVKYSQDINDNALRTPLKPGVGSIGKTIRGSDDIYFFTADKKFTTIGRAKQKDLKPQTENIGYVIKRLLDDYEVDTVRGFEYKDKIYASIRSTDTVSANDITLIYSKKNKAFEGTWDLGASDFITFNKQAYYAESNGVNIHKLFTGSADIQGTKRLPIASDCITHMINLTPSKHDVQALSGVYFEGYITASTTVKFKVYKQFEANPFLSFNFSGTESGLLDGSVTGSFLGDGPIALEPIGAFSDPDADGRRHFQFTVYFPFQYANYFAVGWESNGTDLDYEVIRFGLMVKEDVSVDTSRIKSIV